jgi:hypothetical protein
MLAAVRGRVVSRFALGAAVLLVLAVVFSQAFLPSLAAKRVRDRVARYGTVKSASVSAFPAIKLLWGRADSVNVSTGLLTVTPPQLSSLLWEAHDVTRMTVKADSASLRVPLLPDGLTLSDVRMDKHDFIIQASATLTQRQLDASLPGGFHVEPVASGSGQVEVRASGGFFGLQASISALVRPFEGRLVAEPKGLPFAEFARVTLFSDPHLHVNSVGLRVLRSQPLTYELSLGAALH